MSVSNPRKNDLDVAMPASHLGLYPISVVTELTGLAAGTLRGFERAGLLAPARTRGGTRRYSRDDLVRLVRINALVCAGVNLAGVARILVLESDLGTTGIEVAALRAELARLRSEAAEVRAEAAALRAEAARLRAEVAALRDAAGAGNPGAPPP